MAPGHVADIGIVTVTATGGATGLARRLEIRDATRRGCAASAHRSSRRLAAHVLAVAILLLTEGLTLPFVVHVFVLGAAHGTLRMPRGLRLVAPHRVVPDPRPACRGSTGGGPGGPAVGTTLRGRRYALEAEVAPDSVLELSGDVVVVAVGWAVLDVFFGIGDLYGAVLLVYTYHLHGDQGSPREPEETHSYAYVLLAVGLVHEQVIDLTYLVAVSI